MKRKTYALFGAILVLFGAAAGSIWRTTGSAEFVAAAAGQSVYELDVAQARGVIYDCRLRPLVSEQKKLVAAVAPTIETVGVLEKATNGRYRQRLAQALEDGKPFLLELEKVPQLPEGNGLCVDLFRVPERYSEDQTAAHIVGYLDSLGEGVSGVELAMNDLLDQYAGRASVYYQVDALGRVMAGGARQTADTLPQSQGGVALTLDRQIQELAEEAGKALGKGAVVIAEVPGCELRAVASFPGYSPKKLGQAVEDPDSPLLNRAFSAYAPGSVFKLACAAAALEAGGPLASYTCTGAVNAGGMLFHCYDGLPHGQVDLKQALEKSCNCYFINCARSLGGQSVLNMAYNLGLGSSREFGRGLFSQAGSLPEARSLENVRALANFAFGQGETTVTPVQLCAMVNAIASGGVYASPKLIAGTVDSALQLTPVQAVTDQSFRVMAPATAETLQNCMEGAVKEGTARPGAPENCVAGVKTGTAQTGVYQNGRELHHFWYCGYLCDETGPRYCVTVLAESTPDDKGAAAQTFRRIAEGLAGSF